ncbi:hypothetical protein QBC46DRAFT_411967 [Diplogelasinospora grovesii]|uniref:Uncharacterized protein n=1 Tax=Diplogelasinospora grovesii TaxID=303347 RepID=A0AAN6MZU2_9PEZI|nr:hypothetical protein QBC46DRAFT_411967 [Diplogelasinospora grovesii]
MKWSRKLLTLITLLKVTAYASGSVVTAATASLIGHVSISELIYTCTASSCNSAWSTSYETTTIFPITDTYPSCGSIILSQISPTATAQTEVATPPLVQCSSKGDGCIPFIPGPITSPHPSATVSLTTTTIVSSAANPSQNTVSASTLSSRTVQPSPTSEVPSSLSVYTSTYTITVSGSQSTVIVTITAPPATITAPPTTTTVTITTTITANTGEDPQVVAARELAAAIRDHGSPNAVEIGTLVVAVLTLIVTAASVLLKALALPGGGRAGPRQGGPGAHPPPGGRRQAQQALPGGGRAGPRQGRAHAHQARGGLQEGAGALMPALRHNTTGPPLTTPIQTVAPATPSPTPAPTASTTPTPTPTPAPAATRNGRR